ncbi:MAG TPA: arylsulfatase [Phycisphaerae bacterium]|nr:arylsulfatase [Phycisphaerae bacterium]HOJ72554.1 arylsulfatase [Phycisphaerae bacterium]HOM49785.1 arylsulfatase [Phycisphaerae bacterium]HON66564.1 arylsulfatase [Phycisphaerae bacterium]HPP25154.1 arylsulfatase [Phycisphaerae bacterium]
MSSARMLMVAAVAVLTGIATGSSVAQVKGAPRPNIIIIMSDDMGYSDIGCYGGEIETPVLDRLAAGGLRFSQFYNMARCCPTRASLLTGLAPHQAGVGHMTGAPPSRREPWRGNLSRKAVTIAEVLRSAGYATYMCGKWHVTARERAGDQPDNWPLQRGFDRFYGTITGAGSFYDPVTLTRDNTMITPENDPEYRPERFYYTDAISDNAVKSIADHARTRADKPFFLYVAYTAAHWPLHAPEETIAKYRGRYDGGYEPVRRARFERLKQLGLIKPDAELSPAVADWAGVEHKAWEARCMEVYAAMIDRMDTGIGKIVEELERNKQLDNTLILFLQDNGGCAEPMGREDKPEWHLKDLRPLSPDELQTRIWPPMQTRDGRPVLGGPGVMPGGPDTYIGYGRAWANVSNTPFREYKHWVHEGGISTPLIAHWPEGIRRRGEIEHQPGQVIDLMATCVELSGAVYPAEFAGHAITPLAGKSLVPAFAGKPIDREALYWEHEGNRAIRMGRWKLVAKGPAGAWELYDMETDRSELHDLAQAQPERVKDMRIKWEQWARRSGVLPWIWKPSYREGLRAAGQNRGQNDE